MDSRTIEDTIRLFANKHNQAMPNQKPDVDNYVEGYINHQVPKEEQEHYKQMYKGLKR